MLKRLVTFVHALALFIVTAAAQDIPALSTTLQSLQPTDIFPVVAADSFQFADRSNGTTPATFVAANRPGALPLFRAEVFSPAKSHYAIQASWKSIGAIKRGDVLLARFAIRSIYAKQESGEAVVYFFVQQANPPHDKMVIVDISAGPEWKAIDIPFVASRDIPAGEAAVCVSLAALSQKLEITNLQVLNFDNRATLAQLPVTRFTYQGREFGASWRKEALKRIEDIRTVPLPVRITDAKGKPIVGATVQAILVQPDFIWGTAANEAMLADDLPGSVEYKKAIKELFNTAVIENGLKAGVWDGQPARKEQTLRAFDWLEQQGLRQRGHNLVWPGWKFNPRSFRETAQKDTAQFRKMIDEGVRSKMAVTKGRVIAWDVINELIHERDFLPYLPAGMPEYWFKMAKQLDPGAQLFINEYSMLNSIASPANIRNYLDTIARLRKSGAPIEAIGVQGHVGRQPRNPAQVLSDLDLFVATGLPVQITEFDINTNDETLQADYIRDFLIACYSHPVVTGFTIWGFWESKHWKPDAAMFRKDWTPKPSAAVWRKLVTGEWKTNITTQSGKEGKIADRGHFGKYEITVTAAGKTKKVTYHLTKDATPLVIAL